MTFILESRPSVLVVTPIFVDGMAGHAHGQGGAGAGGSSVSSRTHEHHVHAHPDGQSGSPGWQRRSVTVTVTVTEKNAHGTDMIICDTRIIVSAWLHFSFPKPLAFCVAGEALYRAV